MHGLNDKALEDLGSQIELAARIAHEVNRAYCSAIGDNSQLPWQASPDWQRESALSGVRHVLANPDAKPEDSHANWLKDKVLDGWVWGPKKDPTLKTHPCMVPYSELPLEQRVKDSLFIAVVRATLIEE